MWYVIQVQAGKEARLADLLMRVCTKGELTECFSPKYQTQKKVKGEWVYVEQLLLPGYLIAVTDDVEALQARLRSIPELTRLLTVGETVVPLHQEERAWIGAFTKEGSRCVPMSMGFIEGEKIVVTQGPLKGHEAQIKEVNRRKSLAFLELEICGRKVTTKVGLGIVSRRSSDSTEGRAS